MQVKGRDASGFLTTIELTSSEVEEALREPLKEIAIAVKNILEEMPPDLAGDIVDNGIVLTGGGALIRGLDIYFRDIVNLPVKIADEPLLAVAYGTAAVLDDDGLLKLISNV
jgi:rod shape-determining protein MreB